ncbi:MAG: LL-diaminopimelate aminotransferase [Clostridiales bacterium GWF2_38_85]|nr:MAG: LL-diaminopimelate aminotransferase [Clostridiales bacterium GWF2_38_85]HBL83369.1 LL-diaminopimelate aminotransferase [Clostridiales bacterium]
MKIKVNTNFSKLKESYLFSEIGKRERAYRAANPEKKIIKLGIGDVTLPLCEAVTTAMHNAVDEMASKATFRGYAPEYGYDFLRVAIASYYKNKLGVSLSADEIYVSDGAKSDVGNIPDIFGDNTVLIPDPVYPVYLDSNTMAGRRIEFLDGNKENGFLPTPDGLKGEGYIIYICSPNNPTGAVYTREGLKEWIDFAVKSGSLIIFDSAYEAYIKGDYPHSIFELEGARSCAIEISSFSKIAGFTGTRCAWTIIPDELESDGKLIGKLWKRRQATKFNGVPYVVQRGAEAALSDTGLAQVMESVKYYTDNAAVLAKLLSDKGIFYTGGTSSPYVWLECRNSMKSWDFFDFLLETANIVGTPGAGFGSNGEGFFRLSSFGSRESTLEAVERLNKLL